MESGRKGGEAICLESALLMGDQERRGIPHAKGSSPGSKGFKPHMTPQHWGPTPGRQISLAGLKTSGAYQKVIRNGDSALEEHTHASLLPVTMQKQQVENCWCFGWLVRTAPACLQACAKHMILPILLPVLLSIRAEAAIANDSV